MATNLGRIQLLEKAGTDWAAANPVLLAGELGAQDVRGSTPLIKIGDGTRPWSQLPNLLAPVVAANDYVAGTTTTLPPGSQATVTIDNTRDPPTISIGVPRGDVGPPNVLTVGTVTASAPGAAPVVTITGAAPNQTINFVLPRGDPGPPNVLNVGTVTTGAPGTNASITITGTSPTQTLNMTIPRGDVGPPNVLTVGTVTASAPGSAPVVTITGAAPNQTINFVLPRGDVGPQGVPGPPNVLTVGTVTASAPGSAPVVTITGTAPNQTINFVLPRGDVGPANSLTIGTVTTGAPGSAASATITGTPPNQTLDMTIPRGDTGSAGTPSGSDKMIQFNDGGFFGSSSALTFDKSTNMLTAGGATFSGAYAQVRSQMPASNTYATFQVRDQTGSRTIEMVTAGSTAAAAYGLAPGESGINTSGGSLTFSTTDTARIKIAADGSYITFGLNGNPAYNFLGTGTTTFNGAAIINAALTVKSAGIQQWGSSNTQSLNNAFISFRSLDGTREDGWVGFGTSGGNISLATNVSGGNVQLLPGGGGSVTTPAVFNSATDVQIAGVSVRNAGGLNAGIVPQDRLRSIPVVDTRAVNTAPSGYASQTMWDFKQCTAVGLPTDASYAGVQTIAPWAYTGGGGPHHQFAYHQNGALYHRYGNHSNDTWYSWRQIAEFDTAGSLTAGNNINAAGGLLYLRSRVAVYDPNDGYLRLAHNTAEYPNGVYTPGVFRCSGALRADSTVGNSDSSKYFAWNGGGLNYGAVYLYGAGPGGGYTGLGLYDGNYMTTFMSNASATGIYNQGSGHTKWMICVQNTTLMTTDYSFSTSGTLAASGSATAASFNATSARNTKHITGKPSQARELLRRLARLPVFYKLKSEGAKAREQLGLVSAEDVHEICPQLSDGKTIAYDRLAVLLLADWLERNEVTS